jgi:hypothetical protein
MSKLFTVTLEIFLLVVCFLLSAIVISYACSVTNRTIVAQSLEDCSPTSPTIYKTETNRITFSDGDFDNAETYGLGRCDSATAPGTFTKCYPAFNTPTTGVCSPAACNCVRWSQFVNGKTTTCRWFSCSCVDSGIHEEFYLQGDCWNENCGGGGGGSGGGAVCQYDDTGCEDCVADDGLAWQNCRNLEAQWAGAPYCSCSDPSPILVDVLGNGFTLTNRADGVIFDLNDDGTKNKIAWTAAATDDAWLCLDRNGNGTIDNGAELFGNFTSQPEPPLGQEKNGFVALAEYDKYVNGGNGDGVITQADAVFNSLRLWHDSNQNGVSEPSELIRFQDAHVAVVEFEYKPSKHTDQYGNEFRYRAKVKDTGGAEIGRWAWDVFLVAP